MPLWTLKIGAITRTLAGWGIDAESVQIAFRSFESDTLTFSLTEADVLAEPVINYGDAVVLYRGAVKWFVGRVHDDPVEFNAAREVQKYICKNAWADLETCIWKQERTEDNTSDGDARTVFITKVLLAWRAGVGKIDTNSQLEDVLDFAIADGVAIAYDVDFEGLTPPYQEARDVSVATIARQMGKWTPDLASHFDYTTEPYPTVVFKRRGNPITPVELALDEYLPANGLVEARPIRALRELFVDGVDATFVGSVPDATTEGNIFTQFLTQTAGAATNMRNIFRFTIDLAFRGTTEEEEEPTDFVAAYYAIMSELFYQASLRFRHRDVPGTYRPGMVINFTGGRVAWLTARAIVQSVVESLTIGETVVECGPPPMLNKGTFLELVRTASGVDTYGILPTASVPTSGIADMVACTLSCESKASTATLCGENEFDDGGAATVPPKRYRKKVKVLNVNYTCNGTPNEHVNTDTIEYDALTCATTGTGTTPFSGSYNAPSSYTITKTTYAFAVNFTGVGNGAGCAGGVPMTETTSALSTLSVEDTEADAETRAMNAITDWTTAPSECSGHTSYRTVRTAGIYAFTFRKGRSRVNFSASVAATYRVRTFFKRRVYGSTSVYSPYVSVDVDTTVGVGAVIMPYVETPSVNGYEVLASGATVQRLP